MAVKTEGFIQYQKIKWKKLEIVFAKPSFIKKQMGPPDSGLS